MFACLVLLKKVRLHKAATTKGEAPFDFAGSHKATADLFTKERKKTHNPREGWENGTPPPHRDFKERRV